MAGKLSYRVLPGQPGISRAAWSGDPALPWKANLTALSQEENLYFVALHDKIYVDRPAVDSNVLAEDTVCDLRWKLPVSANAAKSTHHHNPRYTHAVNRLEIGFLGDSEVLGCVCDDGDVLIYTVRSVQSAFEAIDDGLSHDAALGKFLRPWVHFNVGKSAWGLAFQREARLVAVSSNRAEVTVKFPALSSEEACGSVQTPVLSAHNGTKIDRSTDKVMCLRGHTANIPAVAFHITREDDPRVFLLSSDIDNDVFIWDIGHGGQLLFQISIQYHDITRQFGWLVFPIDPETFRLVDSPNLLNGSEPGLQCDDSANVVPLGIPSSLDAQIEERTGSLSSNIFLGGQSLPFSLVHTSTDRVSLLHGPFDKIASCFIAPWRQVVPPFQDHHGTSGTMRYGRFIPELGVIVAGSDLGHVGVFTLTRLKRDIENTKSLGMRLDLVLPFPSQTPGEQRLLGFSGFGCLLGIATAPMPGSMKRRYRIVLEYTNRTLLSYEIWRENSHGL